MDQETVG